MPYIKFSKDEGSSNFFYDKNNYSILLYNAYDMLTRIHAKRKLQQPIDQIDIDNLCKSVEMLKLTDKQIEEIKEINGLK